MAVKTRAELKSENAADFPDNTARLISPADLRGQMDDIVDSALFPEDDIGGGIPGPPGPAGDVRFVSSIAAMRALADLKNGSLIFVGDQMDQFICVDDDTLGADGGTVFIPDSELSAVQEHPITPWDYFYVTPPPPGDYGFLYLDYQLPHTGIDFESMEWVLSDSGETLTVWDALHGHVYQPGWLGRTELPQYPLVDFATGKLRDPSGIMTAATGGSLFPPPRTGGVLIRYRYALSGLRLKRVTGDTYYLRWWAPVATDEEAPGVETNNVGKICWCFNAAARAKARVVFIDKMYNYAGAVEVPDGIEVRGRGIGLSGFRAMKDSAYRELLLSSNAHPASLWKEYEYFTDAPATRWWVWDWYFLSRAIVFLPATGAKRIRLVDLEWDGNIANNLGIFTKRGPSMPGVDFVPVGEPSGIYAYGYTQDQYLFNTTTYCAFACSTQANRVVEDLSLELHNVKMHGYNHLLLANYKVKVFSTGLAEFGDCITGHFTYTADGDYESIRCFGYASGDGMRIQNLNAQSVEFRLYSPPDVMFSLEGYPGKHPTDPNLPGTPGTFDCYHNDGIDLLTYGEWATQQQVPAAGAPYPKLVKHRINIDNLFVDASGLDTYPAGKVPFTLKCITGMSGDNIRIGSGKIRLPSFQLQQPLFASGGNNQGGHPVINNVFENLSIEFHNRAGFSLIAGGNFHQAEFRNITLQPLASTPILNTPATAGGPGVSLLLGNMECAEIVAAEPPDNYFSDGGRKLEFAGAGSLAGKYIDVTPFDPGAPTFRVWFDYNNTSTAPSASGVTLIEVNVGATPTTAQLAAAFSAALEANATAKSFLTVSTFGTVSVVGSYSRWQHELGSLPVISVTNATGVTNSMRAARRNFEPSVVNFNQIRAPDPIYMFLIALRNMGPNRNITLNFRECMLGATSAIYITDHSHNGSLGAPTVFAIRDQVHFNFTDTIFDFREEAGGWANIDLMLYAGHYRNCRVRTPIVSTGLSTIGTGYETLFSEQSGVETWTPSGGTTRDIQTKLFWVPKDGNLRLYPANAATAGIWNTIWPEWRKSSRPVSTSSALVPGVGPGGPYYSAEDRRAPVLRLNFTSAPAAAPLAVGWSAAVSP